MNENRDNNGSNGRRHPQITTTGRIETNRSGGECIKFNISLGLFTLRCIVNVPGEGEDSAPVYVQFRTKQPKPRENGGAELHVVNGE